MNPRVIRSPTDAETWFEEGCFVTELRDTPDDPALSIDRVPAARHGFRNGVSTGIRRR